VGGIGEDTEGGEALDDGSCEVGWERGAEEGVCFC
jgi:hypothetical protein